MPSSSTSLCTTKRNVEGSSVPARIPARREPLEGLLGKGRDRAAHDVGAHRRGVEGTGEPLRDRVGEPAGARVIVGEALDHRLERDDPGGRDDPGLAHARRRSAADARALPRSRAALPQSSDPTGAPSPFERQNITVSHSATSAAGATPSAIAAFQIRAPSQCTGEPARAGDRRRPRRPRRRSTVDRSRACACSRSRRARRRGRWCALPSHAASTCSGGHEPVGIVERVQLHAAS